MVKNPSASAGDKKCRFDPWVGKFPWRRGWQHAQVFSPGENPWTEEPGGLQSIGSQSRTGLMSLSMCDHWTCAAMEAQPWGRTSSSELPLPPHPDPSSRQLGDCGRGTHQHVYLLCTRVEMLRKMSLREEAIW